MSGFLFGVGSEFKALLLQDFCISGLGHLVWKMSPALKGSPDSQNYKYGKTRERFQQYYNDLVFAFSWPTKNLNENEV